MESPLFLLGAPGLALALTVLLARPTPRRFAGALVAGGVVGVLNLLVDIAAHDLRWWWYPGASTRYGPPLFYVAAGLWYGAGVALIGWRLLRCFGGRGLTGPLAFAAIYGPVRDYGAGTLTGMIVFGPSVSPVLADAATWVLLLAVAQAVMWLVAGPARADRLTRPRLPARRAL